MLPPLMLTLNARPTQLYSSKCVRVTMDERTSRVTITAHRGDDGDASCAISGIIQATDALLGRGQQYSVVWDLRDSPTPGFRDTMRLAAWGVSRKANLERLTTKMGVVMREGGRRLRRRVAARRVFGRADGDVGRLGRGGGADVSGCSAT